MPVHKTLHGSGKVVKQFGLQGEYLIVKIPKLHTVQYDMCTNVAVHLLLKQFKFQVNSY